MAVSALPSAEPTKRYGLSRLRLAFGSFVAVEATAPSQEASRTGVAAAFEALSRVEALMHPARPGSDLAALNASKAGEQLSIHPWTWQVLKLSQLLHRHSAGVFDPCLPTAVGTVADLLLMRPAWVVVRLPVQVDLGGIAKGYAVDRAIDALKRCGCDGGLVNAGGDLRVFGTDVRRIVCRDAAGNSSVVALRDQALASSDVKSPSRPPEHRGYYDGVLRNPVPVGEASVLARRAVIADALTKCLLLGETRQASELLARFGAARVQLA